MSRQKFTIIHVSDIRSGERDPTLAVSHIGFSALSGDFTFRETLSDRMDRRTSPFLQGSNPYDSTLRQIWKDAQGDPSPISCGIFSLKNFYLFGKEGLLLHPASGYCVVGHEVNWSAEYARWYIQQQCGNMHNLVWSDDRHSFEINLIDVANLDNEIGIMLCSPGQHIYGHWIIDYVPRLFIATFGQKKAAPYFNEFPSWAAPFIETYGIPRHTIKELPDRVFTNVPSFTMPSAAKDGIRMGCQINSVAWNELRRHVRKSPILDQDIDQLIDAQKLFVPRRSWGSNRAISNIGRLEELAISRGYVSVEPSLYSIAAQAGIFRDARIVLGEDGSALHNIVFTEKGCRLGVISSSPTRINLWHAGICQLMEHRVAYVSADVWPSGASIVDERSYVSFLNRLEAAQAS